MNKITFIEFWRIYYHFRKMILAITLACLMFAVSIYVLADKFVLVTTLMVKDPQQSGISGAAASLFGTTRSNYDPKKAKANLKREIESLKTQAFISKLVENLDKNKNSPELTLDQKAGASALLETNNIEALKEVVSNSLQASVKSESEISIQVIASDSKVAKFIQPFALDAIRNHLIGREEVEIQRAEELAKGQYQSAAAELEKAKKELTSIQNSPHSVMSLASKDRMADFASELVVREKELQLKLRENSARIEHLQNESGSRGSTLFGIGGKIETLKSENQSIQLKLAEVSRSIQELKQQSSNLPILEQQIEDIKNRSESEYSRQKEATQALSRLAIWRQSLATKYEVSDTSANNEGR